MKISILIILTTMFIACKSIDTRLQKELSIQKYIQQNFEKYNREYEILNKIIIEGVKNKLKNHRFQIGKSAFLVDKLIIFNNERTKLYTTLNSINKPTQSGSSSDLVQSLYGVKIKGKWHVYLGNQNLIAMRGGYKTNKYEPFTWEELSYVSHEQMFASYFEFDKSGQFIPRPDIVDKLVNPKDICGRDYISGTEEEGFIKCSMDRNAKVIDSLEYQELIEEINNPTAKERDPIKKVSWWDKLWGAEVPIFETKEWKDYIKNKSRN